MAGEHFQQKYEEVLRPELRKNKEDEHWRRSCFRLRRSKFRKLLHVSYERNQILPKRQWRHLIICRSPAHLRQELVVGYRVLARAVIDASGIWSRPNPIGIDGRAVPGEREAAGRIAYGIRDVIGIARGDYAGKRVLVIGGGHSAVNVAFALMELQGEAPDTEIFWALHHSSVEKLLGGGFNDQLPERGALGLAAKQAMEDGRLSMLTSFAVDHIETEGDGLLVEAMLSGKSFGLPVDRIVVTTGFRPDLSFHGELRIALDPAVEAPPALAPLIDPTSIPAGRFLGTASTNLPIPNPASG